MALCHLRFLHTVVEISNFLNIFTATPEKGVPDFQVRRVRGSVQLRQGLALGAGIQRQGGRKVLIQLYVSTNL